MRVCILDGLILFQRIAIDYVAARGGDVHLWVGSKALLCDEYRASRGSAVRYEGEEGVCSDGETPLIFFALEARTSTPSLFKIPNAVFASQFPSGNRRRDIASSVCEQPDRRTED